MPKAGKHARMRVAVEDIQAIRRVLEGFLKLGGSHTKQRRRVRRTIQKLHGLRVDTGQVDVAPSNHLVRQILWCLAQVPGFLDRGRRALDENQNRR